MDMYLVFNVLRIGRRFFLPVSLLWYVTGIIWCKCFLMRHHIATWSVPGPIQTFRIQCLSDLAGKHDPVLVDKGAMYTILWLKEGSGTYIADIDAVQMDADTIYMFKPQQALSVLVADEARGYVIHFSLDFLGVKPDTFRQFTGSSLFDILSGTLTIPAGQDDSLDVLVSKMKEQDVNDPIVPELMKVMLLLLNQKNNVVSERANGYGNIFLVKKFFNLLEQKFLTMKMVNNYARELSVTPNYLNEMIKKNTGFSARHHIQQRVIMEAKRKIMQEGLSMKEIAYYLGFDDSYHFSKYFKNVSGSNFSEFRKQTMHQLSFI
ncbi:MAG: hypothetical protein BGO70_16295 [Bacteroidetes bacterium 43-93]|nr:MAG: hypothetical protein BGO70_16295 [Bacteroidetes bacterium 43-93]